MKSWHERNRPKTREVAKRWRDSNAEHNRYINARGNAKRDKVKQQDYDKQRYETQSYKHRDREFKRKFGISLAEKQRIFEAQGSKCDCCGTTQEPAKGWSMDHNHKTRRLRGVICPNCNFGIGHFDDDIVKLKQAINYLEKYQKLETPTVPDYEPAPRKTRDITKFVSKRIVNTLILFMFLLFTGSCATAYHAAAKLTGNKDCPPTILTTLDSFVVVGLVVASAVAINNTSNVLATTEIAAATGIVIGDVYSEVTCTK